MDLFRWLTMKYKLNYAYSILALEDEETAKETGNFIENGPSIMKHFLND